MDTFVFSPLKLNCHGYSRVAGAPHPSGGQVAQQQVLPSEQKRAISSRPVLVPSQRENSMLPSARGGRRRSHGRSAWMFSRHEACGNYGTVTGQ